jgi:hypothetical protein
MVCWRPIIGLEPDPNHPGYTIPRLRVYVNHPGATGPANEDGSTDHYDAPLTRNGTSDPDDKVVGLNLKRAFDYMGHMGTLAQGLQAPGIGDKLGQVSPETKEQVQSWLDELNNRGRAATPKKGATEEKIDAIRRFAVEEGISFDEAAKKFQVGGVLPGAPKPTAPETPLQASQRKLADARAAAVAKKAGGVGAGGARAKTGTAAATVEANADASVDFYATQDIAGVDWKKNLGRGEGVERMKELVMARVPGMAAALGLSPQDVGTEKAKNAALSATLKDLTKRAEAVDLFANKVEKDMKTFDSLLDGAAWSTPKFVNIPTNALRRQFSDESLAQLDLAAKQVGAEYERLITGGTLSMAQLHVGAAEDAKKLINGDMPPRIARAVMETMRTEMKNTREAAHQSRTSVQDQLRSLGKGSGTTASAPAVAGGSPPIDKLKEGHVTTFGNGQKWTLKNGQPAQVQ